MRIPRPQLTPKAVLLSIILTVILASTNAYVGLFAGITVATELPAGQWLAALVLLGICFWIYRAGTPRRPA